MNEEQAEIAQAIVSLQRSGWRLDELRVGGDAWMLAGSNGENLIRATGATALLACRGAVEQARTLGMLKRAERKWPCQ